MGAPHGTIEVALQELDADGRLRMVWRTEAVRARTVEYAPPFGTFGDLAAAIEACRRNDFDPACCVEMVAVEHSAHGYRVDV